MTPIRIQRRRTKGWRMPAGAVYIGRGSKWGSPFYVTRNRWLLEHDEYATDAAIHAKARYRRHLEDRRKPLGYGVAEVQAELRGQNLCCWCGLTDPCHGDDLLEIANA